MNADLWDHIECCILTNDIIKRHWYVLMIIKIFDCSLQDNRKSIIRD